MDPISYGVAAKQKQRIEKVIAEPDSTSGVITVPQVIAAGETITIPAGRMAVLPNIQIDGTLNVQGDVFIPSGATMSKVVEKVASTDNAIVRFNGATGDVQNSGVIIDDNNNVTQNGTSSSQFSLNVGGSLKGWLYSGTSGTALASADYLTFNTNNTEKMRIDANGNVGIGVTPSAWDSIINVIELDNGVHFGAQTDGEPVAYIGTNAIYNGGAFKYKVSSRPASRYSSYTGSHYWYTAPSGTAGNPITWTNAMTLDANGQLTLATGINGLFRIQTDANNYTHLRNYTISDYTQIYASVVDNTLKSAILANGIYQSAPNVYGATSDIKLKENIVDTSPKLDKLMKVQVRNFNYIGQEDKQIGVIAQEIEQIFPSIVYETKDTKQVEVEKEREKTLEDGTVEIEKYTEIETQETGETTKNVKYSVIYMMMLKGMQEQQAIINDLKARIEILEGAK